MEPGWLDAVPRPIDSEALSDFIGSFCAAADSLTGRQDEIRFAPSALRDIEWNLEQRMLRLIGDAFGPCEILAEEYFNRVGRVIEGESRLSLVLDPLDGSASYLRGSATYASTVAVRLDGRPIIGVIYEPARRRLFTALAGHGAWEDDRLLGRREATGSRVVVVKVQHRGRTSVARVVDRLESLGYVVERMESTSLKLCLLAMGSRHALVKWLAEENHVVQDWGTAAGLVVCAEAGLAPLDLDGAPWSGRGGGMMICDSLCLRDLHLTCHF